MSQRNQRRIRNALLAVLGVAALVLWRDWLHRSLGRTGYQTGYLMYALVVVLAAYNLRKKLPGLPLGTSANWLQLHIYLGALSIVVFGLHLAWRWPDGYLELTLAVVYLMTFASGLWGLYITRVFPKQLARTSEQVIYERIPSLRHDVLRRSRAAVLSAVDTSGATTLADFYADRVDNYLAAPRGLAYYVRPSSGVRRRVMAELTDLRRFLCEAEESASEQLFALIRKKDDLDFHQARQGMLKAWLFVHIVLTYTLLLLASFHGLMALAMRGGPS